MAELRRLRESDIPQALELSAAAEWNQLPADWRRILRLEPEGCFCIETDGRVVSTATVIQWSPDLAWLGMVLTLPEYRGRGFARRLLGHCLAWTSSETVRLDGTEMGRDLYESLGFVVDFPVERWLRTATLPARASRIQQWHSSYGRPGRLAAHFGPCVADNPTQARQAAEWFLAEFGSPAIWDLDPANQPAADLAGALGFRPFRHLYRMSRGRPDSPDPRLFAFAGFEYGNERLFKSEEAFHAEASLGEEFR